MNPSPKAPDSNSSQQGTTFFSNEHQERIYRTNQHFQNLYRSGKLRELEDFLINEIQYAKSQQDQEFEADLSFKLASVYIRMGEWDAADLLLILGIEKTAHFADRTLYGKYLSTLGDLRRTQGNIPSAFELTQKALTIFQEIGNQKLEAICLGNIACILIEANRKQDAEPFLCQAIELSNKVGDVYNEVNQSINYSKILMSQGKLHAAEKLLEKCVELAKSIQEINLEGVAYINLGLLLSKTDRWHKAPDYFQLGIDCTRKANNLRMLGIAISNLATFKWAHEELSMVKPLLVESCEIFKKILDPRSEAYIHLLISQILFLEKNYQDAFEEVNTAIDLAYQVKIPYLQAILHIHRGMFYYDTDQLEQADLDIRKGIEFCETHEMDNKEVIYSESLFYFIGEKKWDEAHSLYRKLENIHEREILYTEELDFAIVDFFYQTEWMLENEGLDAIILSLSTYNLPQFTSEDVLVTTKTKSLGDYYRIAVALIDQYRFQPHYNFNPTFIIKRQQLLDMQVPAELLPLPKFWKNRNLKPYLK
ncbi:MAG: tetratricopeptide repeat protein [bacterium]|nr:tetratricopeptide repeat protein [bacterium]